MEVNDNLETDRPMLDGDADTAEEMPSKKGKSTKLEPVNKSHFSSIQAVEYMRESIKSVFRKNYMESNCCSKLTYWYGSYIIDSVKNNNAKMSDEMIEDIQEKEGEAEAL